MHGFGLYIGEDVKSGECIREPTSEIGLVDGGNRRVTIYDYQKTVPLFRSDLDEFPHHIDSNTTNHSMSRARSPESRQVMLAVTKGTR